MLLNLVYFTWQCAVRGCGEVIYSTQTNSVIINSFFILQGLFGMNKLKLPKVVFVIHNQIFMVITQEIEFKYWTIPYVLGTSYDFELYVLSNVMVLLIAVSLDQCLLMVLYAIALHDLYVRYAMVKMYSSKSIASFQKMKEIEIVSWSRAHARSTSTWSSISLSNNRMVAPRIRRGASESGSDGQGW